MSVRGTISKHSGEIGAVGGAVSFVHRHANSEAFKSLFREGMTLVEEAAAYLDGPGRAASKILRRPAALAYASESMRMTTRLMQVASWLLLRRAVNEGEITQAQALTDRHRVRLSVQELACDTSLLPELPAEFVELAARSLRLQARVMHLDRSLADPDLRTVAPAPLAMHLARVEAAFRGV